jgi:hypothetical protein
MSYDANRIRRILANSRQDQERAILGLLPSRITMPIEEVIVETSTTSTLELGAANSLSMTRSVSGPLVRANQPNRNGALFLLEDLTFGLPSITGQPITVNHGPYSVGWIEGATLESQPDLGDFVDMQARVWAHRFPDVWVDTEKAFASGQSFFSMECQPSKVGCMECGTVASNITEACDHIVQRSAPRRQINPTFIGAAIVLPPEKPGWPDARLSIV